MISVTVLNRQDTVHQIVKRINTRSALSPLQLFTADFITINIAKLLTCPVSMWHAVKI